MKITKFLKSKSKDPAGGSVDPKKLAETCERLQRLIEKVDKKRARRLQQLEDNSQKLLNTIEDLEAAIEVSQKTRRKEIDDWCDAGCPTIEPVKLLPTIKPKPKKPRVRWC